jgi:hypothetical protein
MKSLKSIELLFDPDLFRKGEILYEKGAVQEIIKINSSLFTIIIREGKIYEVELLKPLLKGHKATCECTFYQSNKTCRHIVAALLYFSEYKRQIQKQKKLLKPKVSKAKSVTVRTLLSDIDGENLKQFVLGYASRDKKFSDALKINFIRQIDLEDNEKKYKVLLDSLIRPVSSKEKVLKETEFRNFKYTIQDLLDQAHDGIALKEYVESSYIVKTVLTKLHYLDHHFPNRHTELETYFRSYYKVYDDLLNIKDLAIQLKNEIYHSLVQLVQASFYHNNINLFNGFELLITHFINKGDIAKLLNDYVKQDSILKEELSITYAQIFRLKHTLKIKDAFYIEQSKTALIEHIIKNIQESGNIDLAKTVTKKYISEYPKEISFVTILLEILIFENKEKEFIDTISKAYVASKDLRLIDLINKYQLNHILPIIRDRIKDNMPVGLENKTKAVLFRKLQDWDGLMALMYEIKDIRSLMQYDIYLFKHFPDEVSYLYLVLVEDYLDKHLGDFAYVFMNELNIHLYKREMKKVAKKIRNLIDDKYSHRTKLSDFSIR